MQLLFDRTQDHLPNISSVLKMFLVHIEEITRLTIDSL